MELIVIPLLIAIIVVPFYFIGKSRPQDSTESVARKIEKEPEPIAEFRRQDSTESAPQRMTQEPESSDTSTSKQSRFKFCIHCGAEVILAAKFCHACGTPTSRVDTQKSEKDTLARDTPLSETSSRPKPIELQGTKQKSRSLVVPALIIAAALVLAAFIFNNTDEENELQTCIRGVLSNGTMNEAQAAILCSGLQSNQR
jgi:hypothetical protein